MQASATEKRVLPHNFDAERAILGAVLLRSSALDDVDLAPDDFYDPRHREIFAAMRELADARKPVDSLLVEEHLKRSGKLAGVGGLAFLSDLLANVATADNIAHYAAIVRDKALALRLIQTASGIAAKGFGDYGTADEYIDEAWRALSQLAALRPTGCRPVAEVVKLRVKAMIERAEKRARGEQALEVVPTGFPVVDRQLDGGLPTGVVSVLGGDPSDGKSAFAKSIAKNAALAGYGVIVFSPEDTKEVYGDRVVAEMGNVPLRAIRSGRDLTRLDVASAVALELPAHWVIDDTAGLDTPAIRRIVRRQKRAHPIHLAVLDYAGKFRDGGRHASLYDRITAVAEGAADLARQENIAVLLLSQLSRDHVKEKRRPQMQDLRQSGELEANARVIALLHRLRDKQGRWHGMTELLLPKVTNGEAGVVVLLEMDKPRATYHEAAEQPTPSTAPEADPRPPHWQEERDA